MEIEELHMPKQTACAYLLLLGPVVIGFWLILHVALELLHLGTLILVFLILLPQHAHFALKLSLLLKELVTQVARNTLAS